MTTRNQGRGSKNEPSKSTKRGHSDKQDEPARSPEEEALIAANAANAAATNAQTVMSIAFM